MLSKQSICLLALALLAASHVPAGDASTQIASSRASFSPRSVVANPVQEDVSVSRFEKRSEKGISARGGAADSQKLLGSTLSLFALDFAFKKLFQKMEIAFPSALGGCVILFAVMVLADLVKPGLGDAAFVFMTPGTMLLAIWLPVFFVPGLAMLPLAPSIGSTSEIGKVLAVTILGFLYSISTIAFTVLALRTALGAIAPSTPVVNKRGKAPAPASPAPYSQEILDFLVKGSVLSGAISIGASRVGFEYASPLRAIYLGFVSFASYVWGARLPLGFTKVVHPLVTSTSLVLVAAGLTGKLTGSNLKDVLRTYKAGTLDPLKLGAGDILMYLLGPSVVSFANAMYSRKTILRENLLVVLTSMLVSSAGGLFGTAAFVRAIGLGGANGGFLRLSMLSRNITTALAIVITDILGGNVAIACVVVVMTGVIGATFGRTLLTAWGITDPMTRGLAVGGAGQGLGVTSMIPEEEAFPFAAMSMVLSAIASTTLVSIGPVRDILISIAGGSISE